jgi:membrane-associated phospholipid phosphatase
MHVASAVLAALPFRERQPRLFVVFLIWAAAIGVTTITTKQHYAIDVLAGAFFGWLCHRVAFRTRSPDARSGTSLLTAE